MNERPEEQFNNNYDWYMKQPASFQSSEYYSELGWGTEGLLIYWDFQSLGWCCYGDTGYEVAYRSSRVHRSSPNAAR